jgi:DNA-binding transcriptional regulator LsrR (DeoR family)
MRAKERCPNFDASTRTMVQPAASIIAVACEWDKTAAILGALRTGPLDYLIIDDRTLSEVEKPDTE